MEHIGTTLRNVMDAWMRDDPALRRMLLGDEGVRVVLEALAGETAPPEDVRRREVRQVHPVAPLEGAAPERMA